MQTLPAIIYIGNNYRRARNEYELLLRGVNTMVVCPHDKHNNCYTVGYTFHSSNDIHGTCSFVTHLKDGKEYKISFVIDTIFYEMVFNANVIETAIDFLVKFLSVKNISAKPRIDKTLLEDM